MPVNIPTTNRPRFVILGGGFGGLELAKRLKGLNAQIVLPKDYPELDFRRMQIHVVEMNAPA